MQSKRKKQRLKFKYFMNDGQREKQYDLEERTFEFAKGVRKLVWRLPKTISNIEDGKQVIRSSGSIGANYIEAREAISKKDELHRLKICRKEAKESRYWLKLLCVSDDGDLRKMCEQLTQEAFELTRIFGAIVHDKEGTRIKFTNNDIDTEE